jgi:ribonuclease P protein component
VKHTIRSSEEISKLFQSAEKSVQKNLVLLAEKEGFGRGPGGRVAYLAGKRLGAAPLRNRSKRMLREAARLEGAPWDGWRCLLVAREGADNEKLPNLQKQVRQAFEKIRNSYHGSCIQLPDEQKDLKTGSNKIEDSKGELAEP